MPPPTMAPRTGSAAEAGVDTAAVTADTASAAASMVFFNIVALQSDNCSTGISYTSGSHTINARGARSVDTDLRAKMRFAIDRAIQTASTTLRRATLTSPRRVFISRRLRWALRVGRVG